MQTRNSKCLKFLTITPPFVQFDSACHCSLSKSRICNFLNLKLPCFLNVHGNIMRDSNAPIFLHHSIYLFRLPMSCLYPIHDFHAISNKWVIYFKCYLDQGCNRQCLGFFQNKIHIFGEVGNHMPISFSFIIGLSPFILWNLVQPISCSWKLWSHCKQLCLK